MTPTEKGDNVEWYSGTRWSTDTDRVPVQASPTTRNIPRAIARMAHDEYARHHGQSFERLHERGGFSLAEVVMLLAERCERLAQTGRRPNDG